MTKHLVALSLAWMLAAPLIAKSIPTKTVMPDVPATIENPLPNDPTSTTIHRLANGLTIYLSPNKEVPRIVAMIAIRAGSKNDPADATGQAHYLEHMLFKGTTSLGTIDYERESPHIARISELYELRAKTKDVAERAKIDKEIDAENIACSSVTALSEVDKFYRSIGANMNAWTSDEETVYHADIPANRLRAWAALESDRMSHAIFRLFPGELETVYEEKNRSMDNPSHALDEEVAKRIYKFHPYGTQPTIGTVEHLKNPSFVKMRAFYETWYVPNNMAIVLSGDFDRREALAMITQYFGSWTPKPLPSLPNWPLPPPNGEERYEIKFESEETVVIAWRTVPASHPDADALRVMDLVVDNNVTGLLNLRLNLAQKVKSSGSHPEMNNDAGHWFMRATPKLGQTPEEALKLLLENVESLKNGDFNSDDLTASLVNFEIKQKMARESNGIRASIIVDSYIKREPWEKTVTSLDRLSAITKNDVVRVARQYLGPNRVVIFRRNGKPEIPNIQKPGFSAVPIDHNRESKKYQELISLPASPQEPHWLVSGKDYQVTPVEGGRLYATKNPYNDLFQLQIHFARGYRHEKKLCEALNLLTLSGAGPYSPEEFKRKLYALGSSLFYSCGEQTSQVILTGIDRNFWPSLELMRQRFDWPVISSGTLDKMVAVKIGAREDEKKDHQSVHYALGQWASRGQESPVLARLSNDELRKLSESSLTTLIRDFPHWQRRVGYIGPRGASEVAKLLDADGRYKPTPARMSAKLLKPAKNQIFFVDRQMNQTQVGFTAGDEVYVSTHHVDYKFYYQYMGGGMNSAIFQEVREARSLAYAANGGLYVPSFKGEQIQLFGLLGCQSDKTPEATELMMRLLNDFPSSSKRFDVAKKTVLESYITRAVEFRSIPSTLMSWEDLGITDGDPRPKQLEQSLSYTLADLENFARRFKDKPLSVYLVGPRERSGIEQLKKLGDWQEKKIADLFPY